MEEEERNEEGFTYHEVCEMIQVLPSYKKVNLYNLVNDYMKYPDRIYINDEETLNDLCEGMSAYTVAMTVKHYLSSDKYLIQDFDDGNIYSTSDEPTWEDYYKNEVYENFYQYKIYFN